MLKKLRNAAAILPLALLGACASEYEPRESIVDVDKAQVRAPIDVPQSVKERMAYEKGVQDVLIDMKGKMRARDRFTWEEPIVDCGVIVPARVMNGMMVPSHQECVQIAPGRWTEEAPTYLPELGAQQ